MSIKTPRFDLGPIHKHRLSLLSIQPTHLQEVANDLDGDDVPDVVAAPVHPLAVGDPDAVALLVQAIRVCR